jgi:hypothetical protein
VLGDACSLADFSVYHPLWAMRANAISSGFLEPLGHVRAWLDRIAAFGHGTVEEMDAADAVRVARDATPTTEEGGDPGDPSGRRIGDRVRVFPEAYGRDPVAGEARLRRRARDRAPAAGSARRQGRRPLPKEGVVILPG